MKCGIIGLPQVGKTSLFKILTKVDVSARGHSNPREAHLGIAKVPDDRLDRLAAQYNPKKLTLPSRTWAKLTRCAMPRAWTLT
jgi:ribosome-binding ATPase YchF (GTP1/OBG family)